MKNIKKMHFLVLGAIKCVGTKVVTLNDLAAVIKNKQSIKEHLVELYGNGYIRVEEFADKVFDKKILKYTIELTEKGEAVVVYPSVFALNSVNTSDKHFLHFLISKAGVDGAVELKRSAMSDELGISLVKVHSAIGRLKANDILTQVVKRVPTTTVEGKIRRKDKSFLTIDYRQILLNK